jgi:putative oxidoreductase
LELNMSRAGDRSPVLHLGPSWPVDSTWERRAEYAAPSDTAIRVCGDPLACYGPLLGRALLSAIFLLSGLMKAMHWPAIVEQMTEEGMAAVPFLLALAILFEIGGGLAILLGWQARLGALALIAFLIPVTLIFHDFWEYEGLARQNEMAHFLKNLTIMGGLLLILSRGAGPLSVDRLAEQRARA